MGMDDMSLREFLEQALELDQQIDSKMDELAQYRRLTENASQSALEGKRYIERIEAKEKELDAEIDKLVDMKLDISGFIDRIDNRQWQCLLRNRYLLGKTWTQVAKEMHCGVRNVHEIHNEIMQKLG